MIIRARHFYVLFSQYYDNKFFLLAFLFTWSALAPKLKSIQTMLIIADYLFQSNKHISPFFMDSYLSFTLKPP